MKFFIVLICAFIMTAAPACFLKADTVYLDDETEIKGIVVENYHSHIVLSTFEGERKIDKAIIKDILYDRREQNLLKLGDFHQEKGNIAQAYSYYKKAYEVNPNCKEARGKFIYIRSYRLRSPERQIMSDMARKRALFKESGRVYEHGVITKQKTPAHILKDTVGVVLYEDNHMPKIASISPESSAAKSGIKEGDIIFSVWGKMTGYLELAAVIDMIINSPSPEIALTLKRSISVSRRDRLPQGLNDIGIYLYMTEEGLRIKSVRPGSDWVESGLAVGDIITDINGEPTRYMPLNAASLKIKENFLSDRLKLDILRDISLWRKEN